MKYYLVICIGPREDRRETDPMFVDLTNNLIHAEEAIWTDIEVFGGSHDHYHIAEVTIPTSP